MIRQLLMIRLILVAILLSSRISYVHAFKPLQSSTIENYPVANLAADDAADHAGIETTATYATLQSDILYASQLLSYKCAETNLLTSLSTITPPPLIPLNVRGQLERKLPPQPLPQNTTLVTAFLSNLGLSYNATPSSGMSFVRLLSSNSRYKLHDRDTVFTPPKRTLVGVVGGWDVALLRDRLDVDSRFSMLLSTEGDRAKGKKVARLLAEIDNEGTVYIRGLEVKQEMRGKGLATLVTAVFCKFCNMAFGYYPKTVVINKPGICATLEKMGFEAKFKKFPVFVKVDRDTGTTLMCHQNHVVDLGPQYPHAVCRAQNIELVRNHPEGGKLIHVLSEFEPPQMSKSDPIERRLQEIDVTIFSARSVAFMATVKNARERLFANSGEALR